MEIIFSCLRPGIVAVARSMMQGRTATIGRLRLTSRTRTTRGPWASIRAKSAGATTSGTAVVLFALSARSFRIIFSQKVQTSTQSFFLMGITAPASADRKAVMGVRKTDTLYFVFSRCSKCYLPRKQFFMG